MPTPGEPSEAARRPTRVLVVIKSLGHGGAERLVVDTIASGDRGSFAYEVAYVLDSERVFVHELESHGTPVHALGASGNLDLTWMGTLGRLLRRGNFDVVHFHLPYSAALGRLVVATLPRGKRPITLYTEHSLWNKVSPLVKMLNRATIHRDGALIAVSPAAYDALPSGLQGRAQIVVHGVDLSLSHALTARREEVRREVRAELGVSTDDVLVVTVANLRSEKGYDVLLDAASIVAARGLPIRFAAVGQGALEDALHERHRELGLRDRFQFLGYRTDALRLLTGADVFVLASHQEGLPVVLMEAMSVGAPVVATSVGGVPQVIHDDVNGILVPPGRPEDLARALMCISADPEMRRRLARQAGVDSAAFDIARASGEIEDIYRGLLISDP